MKPRNIGRLWSTPNFIHIFFRWLCRAMSVLTSALYWPRLQSRSREMCPMRAHAVHTNRFREGKSSPWAPSRHLLPEDPWTPSL